MAAAYPEGLVLTAEERELFERWSADDPEDEWEIERARRIEEIVPRRDLSLGHEGGHERE